MNPYEANLRNVSARLGAWARGMVRLYRKPLIVLLLGGLTTALGAAAGVSAGQQGGAPVEMAAILGQ